MKSVSLIILPFSLLFFAFACQPYESSTEKQAQGAIQDSLFRFTESSDVDVTMFEKGNRFLNIKSNFAKTQQDNNSNYTVFTGNVRINLYDSTQTVVSSVTCSKATYNTLLDSFTFIGAVKVVSKEDKKLFTEQLLWYRSTRTVETEAYVEIITPDDSIYGYGLHSDEQLENYVITKVSGNITID